MAAVILNIPKFLYLAGFLKWIDQQVIIRFGIIYQVKYYVHRCLNLMKV